MKAKLVVPRELAQRDVEDAVAHYLTEGTETAALGFIDALEHAYRHIGRHPATGSPRYAHELNLRASAALRHRQGANRGLQGLQADAADTASDQKDGQGNWVALGPGLR